MVANIRVSRIPVGVNAFSVFKFPGFSQLMLIIVLFELNFYSWR